MIDLWLFLGKIGFLALLYLFILWALRVIAGEKADRIEKPTGQPEPASGIWHLASVSSADSKTYKLNDTGPTAIGRSQDNDIVLDDSAASAHHARFLLKREGLLIQDLNSSNGTFVNGRRVTSAERLEPGDAVRIGRTDLRIEKRR